MFAFYTFAVIIVVVELLELVGFRSFSLLGLHTHIDQDCNLYASWNFKPFLKNGLCVIMCLCVCLCVCDCVCVYMCMRRVIVTGEKNPGMRTQASSSTLYGSLRVVSVVDKGPASRSGLTHKHTLSLDLSIFFSVAFSFFLCLSLSLSLSQVSGSPLFFPSSCSRFLCRSVSLSLLSLALSLSLTKSFVLFLFLSPRISSSFPLFLSHSFYLSGCVY